MTAPAREVLDFIRRAGRRRMILAVITDVAIGITLLVAIGIIGRLITRNPRGMQAEVILFGMIALVVAAMIGFVRAWRRRNRTALEIERRAPGSRNIVLTAAELLATPERSRPEVVELVTSHAANTIRSLHPARLFPARRALTSLAVALAFWFAAIALTAARDPDAPVTLGAPAPADEVGTIDVVITPPAYTKRPEQRLSNPTRIEAIAGSQIVVNVRGTDVHVETADGELQPAIRQSGNPTIRFTAQHDDFIAIRAGASARRLIGLSVTPDQTPRVRVTAPGKDMFLADAARRIPVDIDARDDLGLTSLKLRYTKVSGSGERFTFVDGEIPISITRANERDWTAKGTLDLAALKLEQGDMVVYRGAAADARPGAALTESDAFIIEIVSPLSVASEGFAVDDQQDKYAISQQMVILKTERLIARAPTLSADSLAYYSQSIAAEQRAVRAEFVFMMGGEVAEEVIAAAGMDIDETHEAENEGELAAGRMVNRGRVALVEAIRLMSRASTQLNAADPRAALPVEKAALVSLQAAFSRTRYLLRALTQRERLDLSRRLTGVLTLAARDTRPEAIAPVDPQVGSLRRSLVEIAVLSNGPADPSAASRIAQQVLGVDPSDSTLQRVAAKLGEGEYDDAATALTKALRARLPREDASSEPLEVRRLRGALNDAMRGKAP